MPTKATRNIGHRIVNEPPLFWLRTSGYIVAKILMIQSERGQMSVPLILKRPTFRSNYFLQILDSVSVDLSVVLVTTIRYDTTPTYLHMIRPDTIYLPCICALIILSSYISEMYEFLLSANSYTIRSCPVLSPEGAIYNIIH